MIKSRAQISHLIKILFREPRIHYIKGIWLFSLVFVFVMPVQHSRAEVSPEDSIYTVAVKAYNDGLYDLAVSEFKKLIRKYPDSPRIPVAHFFIGETCLARDQINPAIQAYITVTGYGDENPYYVKACYRLGELYFKQNNYSESRKYLQKTYDYSQDKALLGKAYYWLAEIHYRKEEYADAIEYYEKSLASDPNGEYADFACYSLGWAYYQLKSPSKSVEYFDRILEEFPQSSLRASVTPLRRKSLFLLQRYSDVINLCLAELDTAQGSEKEEILLMLSESYYQLKIYPDAQKVYDAYLQEFPKGQYKADCLIGLAWSLMGMEKQKEAREVFREFTGQFPKHEKTPEALFAIASISLKLNDDETFVQICDEIIAKYPGTEIAVETLFRLGVFHRNAELYEKALESFDKLVTGFPDSQYAASSKYFIGDCYRELKRFDEAIAVFQQIHEHATDNDSKAQALFQLGSCQYLKGDYEQARNMFRNIIQTYPESRITDDAKIWFAESLISLGELEESKTVYNELLQNTTENRKEEIHYKIAEISFLEENWEKAIEDYQGFIRNFPQSQFVAKAFFRMGLASFKLNDNVSGVGFLQQYLNSSRNRDREEDAYYRVAQQLFVMENIDKAKVYYQRYMEKFPGGKYRFEVNYGLALCYMHSGYNREALQMLSRDFNEIYNHDLKIRVMYNLGVCHMRLGDPKSADRLFAEIINTGNGNEIYYKALLELSLMQYDKAEYSQSITRLKQVAQSPYPELKARSSFKLAQHYSSIGNEQKAIDALRDTIRYSRVGSDINHRAYNRLGEIFEQRREWGKAMEAYLYAKETAPDEVSRNKFEKKIKQMKELGALP